MDQIIVAINQNKCIYMWDSNSGKLLYKLSGNYYRCYPFLDKLLYIISGDYSVKVIQWPTNKIIHRLFLTDKPIKTFSFSPNYIYVIAGDEDGKIHLWFRESGELISVTKAHYGTVTCVDVTLDHAAICTGGQDGLIKVYLFSHLFNSNKLDKKWACFSQHCAPITSICTTLEGFSGLLYSSSLDQTINCFCIKTKKKIFCCNLSVPISKVLVTVDDYWFFACDFKGVIYRLNLHKYSAQEKSHLKFNKKILRGHKARVTDLCFSLDGIFLFSSSEDGLIVRWNIWQGISVLNYLVKDSDLVYSQIFVLWNKREKNKKIPSKLKRNSSIIERINVTIPHLNLEKTIRQQLKDVIMFEKKIRM